MASEAIIPELATSTDAGAGSGESQPDPQAAARQSDKEYSAWIKSLREDGDNAKHFRRVKDDFGRLQELHRIDPKGLDGVRSTYDGIKGIAHGDKSGLEAVGAMRDALAESQTSMDAIAGGDFESLSDDVRDGVIRMTPALLDTLAESNPDAYAAAMLPHFVDALRESDLVTNYNALASALSEKPPAWLTKEQIPQWTQEHLRRVLAPAAAMGDWFKQQEERVKELGGKQSERSPIRTDAARSENSGQTSSGNQQYWQEKIHPQTNKYAEESFNRELGPWEKKLAEKGFRLSKLEKSALAQNFVSGVVKLAAGNRDYQAQMGRYNRMKTPDAGAVMSIFRAEFGKHAANVMKALVEENYGDKLKGAKPGPKPGQGSTKKTPPAQSGVKVVSVKPQRNEIDFQRTPTDWIYQNKWRLRNGTVVQFRP